MTGKPVRLWEKIFLLADELHSLCDHVSSPEQVKAFYELNLSQIEMIKKLKALTKENPQGIALKTLAQELGVSAAAVSEQVNGLVHKGMVEREQCPFDRRSVRIRLSDYMTGIISQVERFLDRSTSDFLQEISSGEATLLDALLDKFILKIKAVKQK